MQIDTTGPVDEHEKQLSKLNVQEDRQQLIRLCVIINVVNASNLPSLDSFIVSYRSLFSSMKISKCISMMS